MLPADRVLQETAANIRDLQRRVERLETLEQLVGGMVCLSLAVAADGDASMTISGINQSFLNLWLLIFAREQVAPRIGSAMLMTFNGDAGGNYRSYNIGHIRTGTPSDSDGIFGGTSLTSSIRLGHTGGNVGGDSPNFAACEVNILNYALYQGIAARRAVAWKSWDYSPLTGDEASLDFIAARQGGGQWTNTAAGITSITVSAGGGVARFGTGSYMSLMGLCPV